MLQPDIFKANDIRGVIGAQWDEAGAWALGVAYSMIQNHPTIVVGRDMRVSSSQIQDAFVNGVTSAGTSVVAIGLSSTDGLWFASGLMDLPAVFITASHNPRTYNGIKFCEASAKPVTPTFLKDLAELAQRIDSGHIAPRIAQVPGTIDEADTLDSYVSFLIAQLDFSGMRRLKVVVDAGNGMGGYTAPAVFANLDVELIGLNMDLDGSFPNHPPDPMNPKNLVPCSQAVLEHGADLGLVFDGDADRVVVVDEQGEAISPSAITALIGVRQLQIEPGARIVVNVITSSAVGEIIEEHGGTVIPSKVGHTYMKALMGVHDAIFGGEHSAHYYFRDFFGADTGMLAALHIISTLGKTTKPLSGLVQEYTRYVASGEINSEVRDQQAVMWKVAAAMADSGEIDWLDGVRISGDGWWVSLRGSNTEPLLRLNVEARSVAHMEELRDSVLCLVKEE
ncbi:MAG: phosphomannomutase/phosphoglucomutase [Propionibacteriaceae bacterium]|nr:phosphomannomutase/phosphoglucomutase [Propionibacteriaceae bacterium]